MTKTAVLSGAEVKVTALGGQNVAVKNLGDGSIYASPYPNVEAGADNVVEIPAGGGEVVLDANGTVYLLGTGKAQCTGMSYATPNFKMPSSSQSGGDGGGGTSDVTKAYVDAQDSTNLGVAKAYTDAAIKEIKENVSDNADNISALQATVDDLGTAVSTNTTDIGALQSDVTAAQADIAANSNAIADNSNAITVLQSDITAAQADITDNATAIADNKNDIDAMRSDVIAAGNKADAVQAAVDNLAEKSIVSTEGAFDLRYVDSKLQANVDGTWSDITTGGGVSQDYVDSQDAATLASAKTYTDTKISNVSDDISDMDYRIAQNTADIATLNGTGEGSVSKAVSNGIAAVVADAPEDFDTLKEMSDWISEHEDSAAAMNSQIQTNAADINALETAKADKTEIPTSLPANGGNADTVGGFTVGCDVPEDAVFTDTIVDISGKMDKANPTGTGYVSINRKSGTIVGLNSVAMGYDNEASGSISTSIGQSNIASHNNSVALGYANTASGDCSVAMGSSNIASENRATAIGDNNAASGDCSAAIGAGNAASGGYSVAMGNYNTSSGDCSFAMGGGITDAGHQNIASGYCSTAIGASNIASGFSAFAEGSMTEAAHDYSHAMGKETKTGRAYQLVIGGWNAIRENSLFVIGCGQPGQLITNFRVDEVAGGVYSTGSYYSSGADYAEFIKPWFDDNPNNEDRVGYFVTIKDGKLHKAEPEDYIVGITSGNPSVVGNGDEDWLGRWQRDEFNRFIMEDVEEEIAEINEETGETGEVVCKKTGQVIKNIRLKANPDYDPSQKYIERKNRPEWDYVGMIGVLPLRDDGSCVPGGFAKCGAGGVATAADAWECHRTFFVIERINENVISVEMR